MAAMAFNQLLPSPLSRPYGDVFGLARTRRQLDDRGRVRPRAAPPHGSKARHPNHADHAAGGAPSGMDMIARRGSSILGRAQPQPPRAAAAPEPRVTPGAPGVTTASGHAHQRPRPARPPQAHPACHREGSGALPPSRATDTVSRAATSPRHTAAPWRQKQASTALGGASRVAHEWASQPLAQRPTHPPVSRIGIVQVEGVRAAPEGGGGQQARDGDDVPVHHQRDRVAPEPRGLVRERVLVGNRLSAHRGPGLARDDVVPDNHLVDRVAPGLVLGGHVHEELLHVPVEHRGQVGVDGQPQLRLLVACPHNLAQGGAVQAEVHLRRGRVEVGGPRAEERQEAQDGERVEKDGVHALPEGVHGGVGPSGGAGGR
eukprot:CAMPEP_0206010692 /NCGR_PEP_ID=MMETSP1464-20131121/12048_1 /ASSEMBLY_ACC=CAM_ASM_001124 /TAXON_ID=119497 /ORGANISM="Exanthemachrysis gayraliae, Strain RCC1523" /LENGTH=372 /DNA_ID=CAMNT_0053384321 /DNA_START=59 /DNA_END=1175 /DNA_ORIENTATION=-